MKHTSNIEQKIPPEDLSISDLSSIYATGIDCIQMAHCELLPALLSSISNNNRRC